MVMNFPAGDAVNLVNCYYEGSFFCFEYLDALKGLCFEAAYGVDDEDGYVCDASASAPRFVKASCPGVSTINKPGISMPVLNVTM